MTFCLVLPSSSLTSYLQHHAEFHEMTDEYDDSCVKIEQKPVLTVLK